MTAVTDPSAATPGYYRAAGWRMPATTAFAPSVGSGLIMTLLGGLAAAVGALAGFGTRRT